MDLERWLVISPRGNTNLYSRAPSPSQVGANSVVVKLDLSVPDHLFLRPQINISVNVEDSTTNRNNIFHERVVAAVMPLAQELGMTAVVERTPERAGQVNVNEVSSPNARRRARRSIITD